MFIDGTVTNPCLDGLHLPRPFSLHTAETTSRRGPRHGLWCLNHALLPRVATSGARAMASKAVLTRRTCFFQRQIVLRWMDKICAALTIPYFRATCSAKRVASQQATPPPRPFPNNSCPMLVSHAQAPARRYDACPPPRPPPILSTLRGTEWSTVRRSGGSRVRRRSEAPPPRRSAGP
jgi:hypothetical protein